MLYIFFITNETLPRSHLYVITHINRIEAVDMFTIKKRLYYVFRIMVTLLSAYHYGIVNGVTVQI